MKDADPQMTLVEVKPIPEPPRPLTNLQAEALQHLQAAGRDGLSPLALGKLMGSAPLYQHSSGIGLLKALKKKGHARLTRGGIYVALELPPVRAFHDEIPF